MTDHVLRQIAKRGIRREAVEFVCATYTEHEYDEANDSYQLRGRVAEGMLCVPVTAQSFDTAQMVVKTAYWD